MNPPEIYRIKARNLKRVYRGFWFLFLCMPLIVLPVNFIWDIDKKTIEPFMTVFLAVVLIYAALVPFFLKCPHCNQPLLKNGGHRYLILYWLTQECASCDQPLWE